MGCFERRETHTIMLDDVYHGYLDWNMMFAAERLGRLDAQKTGIAAYLARDSYYNDPRYAETLLTLGFFDVQLFYHNHLQALIGCRDIQTPEGAKALVVIVFRGSDQVQDWLQNLDIRMTRFLNKEKFPHFSRLKVHNGIFERVHDFEDWSRRVIFKDGPLKGNLLQMLGDELKRKQCFFWIIGHSLGGAMATLYAARLCDCYNVSRNRILSHTFGAPPIGNRYFAARYGHESCLRAQKIKRKSDSLALFRFVNTEDPIPAPRFADVRVEKAQGGPIAQPPYRLLGFKHVGKEVRFSPRHLPGFYEKYKQFTGRRYNSSHFMKVHFMEAYITGIDVLNTH